MTSGITDPGILVIKEGLSEKEMENVWELVSSYNREFTSRKEAK